MKENVDPVSEWRHVNVTLYVGIYNDMAVFGGKTVCHIITWLCVKGRAKRILTLNIWQFDFKQVP